MWTPRGDDQRVIWMRHGRSTAMTVPAPRLDILLAPLLRRRPRADRRFDLGIVIALSALVGGWVGTLLVLWLTGAP